MRIWAMILISTLSAITESAVARDVQPLSEPSGHWKLLPRYSDEFNERSLDTNKWTTDVPSWGTWTWSTDNVSVRGGKLRIKMQYQPNKRDGKDLYYTSGIAESAGPLLQNGYFEARIKGASRFPGVCPAFWLSNTKYTSTEIDIIEMEQNRSHLHQLDFTAHVWRQADGQLRAPLHLPSNIHADWQPDAGYHVYGLLWNDQTLTWFVDGKPVASRPNIYWHEPLQIIFSMGLRKPLTEEPSDAGFPTEMAVDYVRVWKSADR